MDGENEAKSRRSLFLRCGFVAIPLLAIIAMLLSAHTADVAIGKDAVVHFRSPSILSSIGDSRCRIIYKKKNEDKGETELLYSLMESPIIVLSSVTNENVIFCLYDFDVDFRLIKFDTATSYVPIPVKDPLSFIVLKSSWKVEEGSLNDWRSIFELLEKMPNKEFARQSLPARDFGVFKQHFGREDILERMRTQIKVKEDSDGGLTPRRLN